MQQKVIHTKIIIDGVVDESITLNMRDIKYPTIGTEITLKIEDAAELSRLLTEKLDGITL